MIENLYELIGGRRTIEAATECFYERVLLDETLKPFVKEADRTNLKSRQVMFLSMLLGGRVYMGKDLGDAHARVRDLGLNDAHFDLFLKHLREALEEVGVEPENAAKVLQPLENKRKHVLDS